MPSTSQLGPGDALGPYRLRRLLGRGGMGEVWEAWDERLERLVAIKRLTAVLSSAEARERVLREARAAASLCHPAVVQVYDVLDEPAAVGRGAAIVMERVEGETLRRRLARLGPLPAAALPRLGREIAEGLAAAHRQALLHRDLKSDNVMLTGDGRARLLDFGISAPPGTVDGAGTPRTMSPEQRRGRPLDARSDLYALGLLLHEAATGRLPEPGSLVVARGVLSPPLADLVARLLELDPAHRPADAAAVAAELASLERAGAAPGSEEAARDDRTTLGGPGVVEASARSSGVSSGVSSGASAGSAATAASGALTVPRGLAGRSVALGTALAAAVALAAVVGWSFLDRPAAPLRVAVPTPTVEGPLADSLAPVAVRATLVDSLLAAPGLAPVSRAELAAVDAASPPLSPAELAAAVGADEVLVAQLTCRPLLCALVVERLAGDRVLAVARFESPADDLYTLGLGVEDGLRQLYPELREAGQGSRLAAADRRRYLEIWQGLWHRQGDRETMLADLLAILQRSPDHAAGWLLAAQLAYDRYHDTLDDGDRDRAFALARRAREASTDPVPALLIEGDLALEAGRLEHARTIAATLRESIPGAPEVGRLEAKILDREGRPDAALATLREVVARRPSISHRLLLARMAYRGGAPGEARRVLEDLLVVVPENGQALSLLAEIELASGDAARAGRLYAQLAARYPRASYWSNAGLAALLVGEPEAAIERFRAALELAPGHAGILLNLGDAEFLAGREELAASRYREVVAATDELDAASRPQLHSVRAQALAHLGERRRAVAAVQNARRLAPENPNVALEAAIVFHLVGDRYSALAAVEQALAAGLEPRWLELPWLRELAQDPELAPRLSRGSAAAAGPSLR